MDASDAIYDREEGDMSEHPIVESTSSGANLRASGTKNIVVCGGGKELGKQMKSMGGKWNAKERGYVFPNGKSDEVQALIDSTKASGTSSSSLAEDPTVTAEGAADAPGSSSGSADPAAEVDTGGGESSGVGAVEGGTSSAMDTVAADTLSDPVVEGAPTKGSAAEGLEVDEPKPAEAEAGEAGSSVPAAASSSSSSSSAHPVSIVQINMRSIAVLGDPPVETHSELNKHGKYSKAIAGPWGGEKRSGWTMGKSLMGTLSKLLPGISLITLDKEKDKDKASAGSPTARSPTGRKSGSSSKSDTPATSPDTPEKEKRKRQRTSKAEESAVQAHAPHAGEQPKVKT